MPTLRSAAFDEIRPEDRQRGLAARGDDTSHWNHDERQLRTSFERPTNVLSESRQTLLSHPARIDWDDIRRHSPGGEHARPITV
jgi:hypothetical protein